MREFFLKYAYFALLLMLFPLNAQSGSTEETIQVVDFTPRFVAFFDKALSEDDADRRFELWKRYYDFVALPPGLPDRDERARVMLDEAWPNYHRIIDDIRSGAGALSPQPGAVLERVANLFDMEEGIPSITLFYYVGMFEGNAFFAAQPDGALVVGLPAEMTAEVREVAMAHELAHALHHALSGLAAGADGSVADLVFSEGIAQIATSRLFPHLPDHVHLSASEDWAQICNENAHDMMVELAKILNDRGPDSVNRMTLGPGPTGFVREGYCTGWHLVKHLLDSGRTIGELVRLAEPEVVRLLAEAIEDFR